MNPFPLTFLKFSLMKPSNLKNEAAFPSKLTALVAMAGFFLAAGLNAAERDAAGAVPSRPEALKYPALKYEPPAPEKYRVKLKSGPVAYVVPDRELPLVNLVIYVRTGEYLDPAGKEGLANLTGYLLAR